MIKDNILKLNIPPKVKLIAVTKTRTIKEIKDAIKAGIKCIGENKVQEAEKKFPHLPEVEKHMIGHLQRNKVKKAVELFDMIQSVDTLKIAKEINKRCSVIKKIMPILIEINIGNEETKQGIKLEEINDFLNNIKELRNIRVEGLMCIAPFVKPEKTRPYFKKMKQIFDCISGLKWLSMGMSNDYKVAIEEGSNMVRIGTAIFGERKY